MTQGNNRGWMLGAFPEDLRSSSLNSFLNVYIKIVQANRPGL